MTRIALAGPGISVEDDTTLNLDAVTAADEGDAVDMRWYSKSTVFINVTVNAGAVTVNIEASYDGTTWFGISTKTYTGVEKSVFSYSAYFPYMRTATTTQSNSTVTTKIVGRS